MSKEIARLADVAMYEAEPIDEKKGPQVYLLNMTPQPLRTMAAAAEMYRGHVVRDVRDIPAWKALEWLKDMQRTKTQAPMEFVDLHFLFEGVTRAFTHQLVRQRTAVYVQESMRFAVKSRLPVASPASGGDESMQALWEDTIEEIESRYNRLIDKGMPAEDARGILPTNTLTRVHYKTNLRNLVDHAGMRLCSQAQYEWKVVWARILTAIRGYNTDTNSWQQDAIAGLFKPICYQEGRCKFRAATDRACTIRERVEKNYAEGIPPENWENINPIEPLLEGAARVSSR